MDKKTPESVPGASGGGHSNNPHFQKRKSDELPVSAQTMARTLNCGTIVALALHVIFDENKLILKENEADINARAICVFLSEHDAEILHCYTDTLKESLGGRATTVGAFRKGLLNTKSMLDERLSKKFSETVLVQDEGAPVRNALDRIYDMVCHRLADGKLRMEMEEAGELPRGRTR